MRIILETSSSIPACSGHIRTLQPDLVGLNAGLSVSTLPSPLFEGLEQAAMHCLPEIDTRCLPVLSCASEVDRAYDANK